MCLIFQHFNSIRLRDPLTMREKIPKMLFVMIGNFINGHKK